MGCNPFSLQIRPRYRESGNNVDADCFSRLPLETSDGEDITSETFYTLRLASLPVTRNEIARHTVRDPLLGLVLDFIRKWWPSYVANKVLKPFFDRRRELTVDEGCLMHAMRLVVAPKLQRPVG